MELTVKEIRTLGVPYYGVYLGRILITTHMSEAGARTWILKRLRVMRGAI